MTDGTSTGQHEEACGPLGLSYTPNTKDAVEMGRAVVLAPHSKNGVGYFLAFLAGAFASACTFALAALSAVALAFA